jgi:hypothetical protein
MFIKDGHPMQIAKKIEICQSLLGKKRYPLPSSTKARIYCLELSLNPSPVVPNLKGKEI